MKGGRKPVLRGVGRKHLRIRYVSVSGRIRGFYARWRPSLQQWECQLSGYGIKPQLWFSKSQTLALDRLRFTRCLWDWKPKFIDESVEWDGISNVHHDLYQYDLFYKGRFSSAGVQAVSPSAPATRSAPVRTIGGVSLSMVCS